MMVVFEGLEKLLDDFLDDIQERLADSTSQKYKTHSYWKV